MGTLGLFRIDWRASGIFAWLKQRGQSKIESDVGTITRGAQQQALREWVTRRTSPSLSDRFKPSAFGIYGFTPRSDKYQRRQIKVLGKPTPYLSPRRRNYGSLAKAVSNPKASAMSILRAAQQIAKSSVHMRDLVRIPGGGYSIQPGGGGARAVTTVLKMPGARILNKGGSRNEPYRKQLLDLTLGGGRDANWIVHRTNDLIIQALKRAYGSAPTVPMTRAL